MRLGKRFISTFSLVSRIPFKRVADVDFSLTGFYLPLIGIVILLINMTIYTLFASLVPEAFLTVITLIAVQYLLFNLFHFDGLLDTADALAVHADREKRLEILKDVSVGAYGFFFGALYVSFKLYLLYRGIVHLHILTAPPAHKMSAALFLFSYPVSGRIAASLIPCTLQPAKEGGLGALLKPYKPLFAVIGSLASVIIVFLSSALMFRLSGNADMEGEYAFYVPVFLGGIIGYLVTYFLYRRKIGGFTGDTLGFAVETGELFHLIIFYLLLLYGL